MENKTCEEYIAVLSHYLMLQETLALLPIPFFLFSPILSYALAKYATH